MCHKQRSSKMTDEKELYRETPILRFLDKGLVCILGPQKLDFFSSPIKNGYPRFQQCQNHHGFRTGFGVGGWKGPKLLKVKGLFECHMDVG